MADVKRTVEKAKPVINKPAPIVITLPTGPSAASDDLNDYYILIHGEKKIGKTTLSTVEEGTLLLTFDPQQKSLEIMQLHMPTWNHFMATLLELEKMTKTGTYRYKRVVLDGADIWYRQCQEWACKKLVITHPSESDWGKGWDLLKTTFAGAVDRLMALPGGCWFISHSDWKEVQTRKKDVKVEKLVPLLKAGGEEILVGRVDAWFAYAYDEKDQILIILGDETTGAGHRIRGHFLTPKGRRIEEIYMGKDEFEAYDNLKAAFHNKQLYINIAEKREMEKKKGGSPQGAKK